MNAPQQVAVAWSPVFATKDPVPSASEVRPGWVLALVVILLTVITVGLLFNMRSRLGRLGSGRDAADAPQAQASQAGDELADQAQGERPAGLDDRVPGAGRDDQNDGPTDARADDEAGGSNPA